jgi:hypothetical protein
MIERRRTSLGRPGAHVILRDVLPPPVAAESAEPAGWAQARYEWGGPWVTREVGLGFEAYVRVLHPYGEGEDAETWAEVAAAHGKVMHPAAHWDEITADGPWNPRSGYDANRNGGVYLEGYLPQPILRAVCDVLRRHTATPDVCFFAVWDGWGWDTAVTVTATRADTGAPPTEVPTPILQYGSTRMHPGSVSRPATSCCTKERSSRLLELAEATTTPAAASSGSSHPRSCGRQTTPGTCPPRSTPNTR